MVSCKRINNHAMKYGYITDLTLSNDISYYKAIRSNLRLLKSIIMKGFYNPIVWIPVYTDRIILQRCEEEYENIVVFCMSNNYEIVTHIDNLIILIKSRVQPQLRGI